MITSVKEKKKLPYSRYLGEYWPSNGILLRTSKYMNLDYFIINSLQEMNQYIYTFYRIHSYLCSEEALCSWGHVTKFFPENFYIMG